MEKIFFHHIRRTDGVIDKQIDILDNFDAAKKSFRQFMSNYAYGNNATTDLVQAFLTDNNGIIFDQYNETWIASSLSSNVFFMHRIRHDKTQEDATAWTKGIEVKDTYDAAQQSFNTYLGAYAYQQTQDTMQFDLVDCKITDAYGTELMNENWRELKDI